MIRRSLLAAAVACATLMAAGPGSAEGVHAGACGIRGTATFTSPVTAIPQIVDFDLAGQIQCYDITNTPAPGLRGAPMNGTFTGLSSGNVACEGGSSSGTFEAIFHTGTDTRDVWSGTFGTIGGPASVATVGVRLIEHQRFDTDLGEWVTDTERPSESAGVNLMAGAFVLTVADPAVCDPSGAGTSEASFMGQLAHVIQTSAKPAA